VPTLAGSKQTYTTLGLSSASSVPEGRQFTGLANHRTRHLVPSLKPPDTHAAQSSTHVAYGNWTGPNSPTFFLILFAAFHLLPKQQDGHLNHVATLLKTLDLLPAWICHVLIKTTLCANSQTSFLFLPTFAHLSCQTSEMGTLVPSSEVAHTREVLYLAGSKPPRTGWTFFRARSSVFRS
jgi:hypothetical protein